MKRTPRTWQKRASWHPTYAPTKLEIVFFSYPTLYKLLDRETGERFEVCVDAAGVHSCSCLGTAIGPICPHIQEVQRFERHMGAPAKPAPHTTANALLSRYCENEAEPFSIFKS